MGAGSASPRFWGWLALAAVSAGLWAGTLAWPSWIEVVFRADPDLGSGWLERAIVVAALAVIVACSAGARRRWQRPSRRAVAGDGAS
jgi:membrane protein DedA with SNARE-associated domain